MNFPSFLPDKVIYKLTLGHPSMQLPAAFPNSSLELANITLIRLFWKASLTPTEHNINTVNQRKCKCSCSILWVLVVRTFASS